MLANMSARANPGRDLAEDLLESYLMSCYNQIVQVMLLKILKSTPHLVSGQPLHVVEGLQQAACHEKTSSSLQHCSVLDVNKAIR